MLPLRKLSTKQEVAGRIELILRHRPDLYGALEGPRPPLSDRKSEPKIGLAWLAARKLEKITRVH